MLNIAGYTRTNMGRLKILARGNSPQAQAQARGDLFETLMTLVLRHYGYQFDTHPNVNYAGMEIDIDGKAILTNVPLYAECKCHETDISSPMLQAFFGKYMTRWFKDRQSVGLFIALPGLNSHAKGFYREHCEGNPELILRLLEEADVLTAMCESQILATPDTFPRAIQQDLGTPGDSTVLYTDIGCFWVQYVIPMGSGIANSLVVLDAMANPITSSETIDYLTQLYPELADFENLAIDGGRSTREPITEQDTDQIVEVRGSSAYFEYQFPASPEYFVGREVVLEDLDSYATEVIEKATSARGIVFEANSGWGKSSLVLASVARLQQNGHFAVAIDSRTASTSQFILRAIEYALNNSDISYGLPAQDYAKRTVTGFDGALGALTTLGCTLEDNHKVLFIFFDQFENVFFLPDALRRIRDLFVKVVDAQTNIVFGFSWKSDLIGSTNEFPYQMRDTITSTSRRVALETFSDKETTILLDHLRDELRAPLRKDLRFFLSEFSQGYPWLLKKLCAHVKAQREAGVRQQNMADSLLNVEELFQADLRGLSNEEDDTLRRIARVAPVSVAELGEEFNPAAVQSLVDARLIVRVGPKYDIYWDIFRDYLNAGRVPVQENYILHIPASSMFRNARVLVDQQGQMNTSDFQQRTQLSDKSFYNLIREMRLLGLITVENDNVKLEINLPSEEKTFEEFFREHLRERLRRNRLVSQILSSLEVEGLLDLEVVSTLLMERCPYISASEATWTLYARRFAEWMDTADLATYNKKEATIEHYSPGTELRERNLLQGRSRGGMVVPAIQYAPIEDVAVRIIDAMEGSKVIDWGGTPYTTRSRALAGLEQLGFIRRVSGRIRVSRDLVGFVKNGEDRSSIFATRALAITSFATFVHILEEHQSVSWTLEELGLELRKKLKSDWKESTSKTNAKVMLNWARRANLAPERFQYRSRMRDAD